MSAKKIGEALFNIGVDPESLNAVFVTHEHSDHIKGLRVFASKYPVSYTHLDVYKRQVLSHIYLFESFFGRGTFWVVTARSVEENVADDFVGRGVAGRGVRCLRHRKHCPFRYALRRYSAYECAP